ncbi:LYPLAL1, partial [Symbiodinium necroappetens]
AVTYADGDQEDWPIHAELLASARAAALRRMQLSGLQLQRPSFLFPGLKAKPFWPREDFPKVVNLLEARAPRLSAEVHRLLADGDCSSDSEERSPQCRRFADLCSSSVRAAGSRSRCKADSAVGSRARWAWLAFALGAKLPRRAAASESCSQPAAVVFLHGSGDSGAGLKAYLRAVDGGDLLDELAVQGIKTYWPDSGVHPYTLAGGESMPIWYDRKGLPPTAPEDTASVEKSVHILVKLLDKVRADGVPANRIVIGGFSMGGGIALQLALRHPTKIAAAFVLSSFMCDDVAAYALLQTPPSVDVPILMMHGEADWFIRPVWGKDTAARLKDAGLNVDFVSIPGLRHEISRKEIALLRNWLWNLLKL